MNKWIFCILNFFFLEINAQQYIGLYTSNYAGVQGLQFNPARSTHNYLKYDINIVSAGVSLYNEYGYLSNETVFSGISKKNAILFDKLENAPTSNDLVYDFFNRNSNFNNLFNLTIGGPGFMLKKNRIAFGLFTNFKTNISAIDIDKILNYDTVSNLNHYTPYRISDVELNAAAYSEIGLNFSYDFDVNYNDALSVGLNVKTLLGHEAAYIKNLRPTSFYKNSDSSWVRGGDLELGFATGLSSDAKSYTPQINGVGFSFDIGTEYVKKDVDNNVKYKLGAAIKDLGYIHYTSNAQAHRLTTDSLVDWYNNAYKQIKNYESAAKIISQETFNDSIRSYHTGNFTMATPASITLYGEYAFNKFFMVNVFLSRRLNLFAHQVQSANNIAITPRFEHRWFEFGIPVSLVEDKWLGMGMYMRLAFLTIGTDHFNTYVFKQSTLQGSDFYLALKFNPFKNKESKKRNARGKKSGDYGCFYR